MNVYTRKLIFIFLAGKISYHDSFSKGRLRTKCFYKIGGEENGSVKSLFFP